jgi:hypothetical protein
MEEIRIMSPVGMLGYGFPEESFQKGMEKKPHVIAADAGSTDAGPHKLGAGVGIVSKEATKKDLTLMLKAGCKNKIPVIVGSAGGSGAEIHLNWTVDIVKEIAKEQHLHFKMALIHAEIEKDYLKKKLSKGKVKPLGPVPELNIKDIEEATRIVAVMGTYWQIQALEMGADVIIAGRSNDPAMFAALPIKEGFDPGLALHMGKILECGAMASTPGTTSDCMMGYLREDYFIVEPTNPMRKSSPSTVAAHTLYEKSSPLHIIGPEGVVDVTKCKFEQYDERAVKVSGSILKKSDVINIKLEGAIKVAYRTICIAGVRDPIMIRRIDECEKHVRKTVLTYFSNISPEDYRVIFHVYGKNGVMGELEPQKEITSHELCLVLEVVAKQQELANTICAFARSTLMHYSYQGRVATAGNLAFPYAPSDIPTGAVYRFNVHHLMEIDNPDEVFPIEIVDV